MAFPTTGILDDFVRANENPITVNWTNTIKTGDSTFQLLSNSLRPSGGGVSSAWYDISTYGPDSEVYVTLTTKAVDTNWEGILLRVTSPGATPNGYAVLVFTAAGTDIVRMYRYDAGVPTQLGADINQEFSNGDKLGADMIGDQFTSYRYSGGSWATLGTRTDATYGAAGYLAVRSDETGAIVFNDFGGGTVVTGANTASIAWVKA